MVTVTATAFLGAVSGLIRVGRAGRAAYRESVSRADLRILPPAVGDLSSDQLAVTAIEHIRQRYFTVAGRINPAYSALFAWRDDGGLIEPDAPSPQKDRQIDAAIAEMFANLESETVAPEQLDACLATYSFDPVVRLQHKEWLTAETQRSPWALFGLELADTALEIVETYPGATGLQGTAAAIVESFAPSLRLLIDEQIDADTGRPGIGKRLMRTFLGGATTAAVRHPDLFAGEERWRPVISAFVLPLHDSIRQDPNMELFGHRRLRELLTGPMAHAAISAVHADADAFLGDDDIAGEVARRVFGDLASLDARSFHTSLLLSPGGARRVYSAALKTAQERPELFIHGRDDETVAARQFLSKVAETLDDAPAPYNLRSGLGAEIAAIAFDVAADYSQARIIANIGDGDSDWEQVWEEISNTIVRGIFDGFKAGLSAGGVRQDLFARVFSRAQAADVVRIVATHVAATPRMAVGRDANSEVRNIAQGVAQFVAKDEFSLLSGDDWRILIGEAMTLASANPGVLFSVDRDDIPEEQIAVRLVGEILARAGTSMQAAPRGTRGILFGATLRAAISDTLAAASNTILVTLAPTETNPDPVAAHVHEVGELIDRLLGAARGDDPEVAMSAADWLYVFRHYVAHVLEKGPGTAATVDKAAIRTALQRV